MEKEKEKNELLHDLDQVESLDEIRSKTISGKLAEKMGEELHGFKKIKKKKRKKSSQENDMQVLLISTQIERQTKRNVFLIKLLKDNNIAIPEELEDEDLRQENDQIEKLNLTLQTRAKELEEDLYNRNQTLAKLKEIMTQQITFINNFVDE
eukprot:TRINITY_DN3906_c0_g1_i2.p2 TRINITY_DN3906_c0_g1~~TRINITY_DN3906_c0_g1_i2.p2  ORF type:complete len:152 (+),score=49.27 TRINITY_DN3906_c0_g1_i2:1085-1540(+)